MLLGCLGTVAHAQFNLQGTVLNTEGEKVEYATVRLLQTDSALVAGTVTDTLGIYRFKANAGDYLLAFSTVGYKTSVRPVTINRQDITFPPVTLESDNVMLGEVVVKGSSFIRQKDRILVIPDKQQVKHANTGYDLLYNLMIPNVEVDKRTGKVSTLGGSVTLYINGEKADYRDVQSLRPRDIENVEYYDVPTGKYANDVAAINYITKQYKTGGYMAVDGKQTIGYLAGDYNVNGKLNKDATTYSVWGGYGMTEHDGMQSEKHEHFMFPDYDLNRDRTMEGAAFRNNQQYIQFKAGHAVSGNNVSVQASLVRNYTPKDENGGMLDYSGHYTRKEQSTESKVSKNLQPSVYLYGSFSLPHKQRLEFSAKGTYSQNDYERTYGEDRQVSYTDVDENMYMLEASGRYDVSLKHKNSFGVYVHHLHRVTSSSYAGDYTSWQHLWSGESLLFLNYTQSIGKAVNLNVSPGLSMLNYKLHDRDLQKQYSFRLKTNLAYRMKKGQQLVVAANIGNNTPNISYINTMDQNIDFLQVRRGNPELKNTKLYEGDIMYGGQFGRMNLQAVAVYEFSQHAVYADYYMEGDKLVSSYRSDANVNAFMFQTNASYRFSDNLRMRLSGGYLHMALNNVSSLVNNCVFGSLDVNYYWKDFSFNAYGNGSTSRLNKSLIFVKNPIVYGVSASWSKKGWYAEVGTENPFTSQAHYKEHANYGIYSYNQVQSSRTYQQTGYIKVAYTFDFGKKTSRERKDIRMDVNSAILKTE